MISELAKTLLEVLKLAPRYLVALGSIAALLLFGSERTLNRLGVLELTQAYRPVLGITLLVCAFVCGTSLVIYVSNVLVRWQARRKFYQRLVERLHQLTEDEMQILRFYYAEKTRANVLRVDDGVVQGLVEDGLIYRSASLGSLLEGFAHNINDFVWNYTQAHPSILEGETSTYRTDKRRRELW